MVEVGLRGWSAFWGENVFNLLKFCLLALSLPVEPDEVVFFKFLADSCRALVLLGLAFFVVGKRLLVVCESELNFCHIVGAFMLTEPCHLIQFGGLWRLLAHNFRLGS